VAKLQTHIPSIPIISTYSVVKLGSLGDHEGSIDLDARSKPVVCAAADSSSASWIPKSGSPSFLRKRIWNLYETAFEFD